MECQHLSKIKRWKIMSLGNYDGGRLSDLEFTCLTCGEASVVSGSGLALAQVGSGIVFDSSKHWMPETIRCPHCKSTITNKKEHQ